MLADLGYVGVVLFALSFVLAFGTCRRIRSLAGAEPDNEQLQEISQYASALAVSMFSFIVGGTFVSIQYNEMIWHLLSLSIVLDTLARKYAKNAAAISSSESEVRESGASVLTGGG